MKAFMKCTLDSLSFVSELISLEKKIKNKKIIGKILRSLPRAWEPKVTAIEKAKKLKTLIKIN
ncbi:hypothetical protein NC652_038279 [Populus alba x Populus x berolinensis]|nr:hypothetical protein NC652_038279 [Populus alba x Populus x berolinensis]